MRLSLRNFIPYGPSSSDSDRISEEQIDDQIPPQSTLLHVDTENQTIWFVVLDFSCQIILNKTDFDK